MQEGPMVTRQQVSKEARQQGDSTAERRESGSDTETDECVLVRAIACVCVH